MNDLIASYFNEKRKIFDQIDVNMIKNLFERVLKTYKKDGTLYVMGNGGSSSAAEGFAVDIRTHPFVMDDKSKTTDIRRLKVYCCTESSGLLTGISNDLGFVSVFSEQLKNFMRSKEINKNDTAIFFTSSGNSANMLNAAKFLNAFGVYTSAISGRGGGKLKDLTDNSIVIPGSSNFPGQTGPNDNNFHIEDFQVSISHIITGLLRDYISDNYFS